MDFIDEFIEEYKNNPCLWKTASPDYKNKALRQEAYKKMIEVALKHGEHYNVERTKQKINNLRCAFRHQLKKVNECKSKGDNDEQYCPKRRYFESLMFLKDEECTDRKAAANQKQDAMDVKSRSSDSENMNSTAYESEASDIAEKELNEVHVVKVIKTSPAELTCTRNAMGTRAKKAAKQPQILNTKARILSSETIIPAAVTVKTIPATSTASAPAATAAPPTLTNAVANTQTVVKRSQTLKRPIEEQQQQHKQIKIDTPVVITKKSRENSFDTQLYEIEQKTPVSVPQHGQSRINGRKRSSSISSIHSHEDFEYLQPSVKTTKVDVNAVDLEKLLSLACKGIPSNGEDHFTNLGKVVAHKLRTMDATQALYAEKVIGDVLFQGQLKLLSTKSVRHFESIESSNSSNGDKNDKKQVKQDK